MPADAIGPSTCAGDSASYVKTGSATQALKIINTDRKNRCPVVNRNRHSRKGRLIDYVDSHDTKSVFTCIDGPPWYTLSTSRFFEADVVAVQRHATGFVEDTGEHQIRDIHTVIVDRHQCYICLLYTSDAADE